MIGRLRGDERIDHVVGLDGVAGLRLETSDAAAGPPEDAQLRIPEEIARALLDALSRHFGGTGDTRQLRRDYDAERARVDRLIAALVDR